MTAWRISSEVARFVRITSHCKSISPCSLAVMMSVRTLGASARRRSRTCTPPVSGRWRSSSATSGLFPPRARSPLHRLRRAQRRSGPGRAPPLRRGLPASTGDPPIRRSTTPEFTEGSPVGDRVGSMVQARHTSIVGRHAYVRHMSAATGSVDAAAPAALVRISTAALDVISPDSTEMAMPRGSTTCRSVRARAALARSRDRGGHRRRADRRGPRQP